MKNRGIAIVLAFFLGGFGLHKFYLGNNVAGIIYLLFSWTLIPSILAFFDFLGLVLMSDEGFNRQFNGIAESAKILTIPKVIYSHSSQKSSKEITETLGELKKLYDNGIITAEEYEIKRRKLLDSL